MLYNELNIWSPWNNPVVNRHEMGFLSGIYVVTDKIDYDKPDQVFPLHPENRFFLDELVREKMEGSRVLEIGLGSGFLSIAAAKAGADSIVALEINPRAKIFAGYNIMMHGLEDKIDIRDGDTEQIFKPVEGEKFDYIISNPPFEPTPPGIVYYLHSSGGIYGLDFVKKIFEELEKYLTDDGHAQIVAFSPGDENSPFMLVDLVQKHLKGRTRIKVNPASMRFNEFVDKFVDIGRASQEQVGDMKQQAAQDGVTHLYLCVVHYEKGKNSLTVESTTKVYQKWNLPINSDVPMGYKDDN